MNELAGLQVVLDHNLPYLKFQQVRFPRSKKVRIRKKWRKRAENFREVSLENPIWMIGGKAYMHPVIFDQLKRQIGNPNEGETKWGSR